MAGKESEKLTEFFLWPFCGRFVTVDCVVADNCDDDADDDGVCACTEEDEDWVFLVSLCSGFCSNAEDDVFVLGCVSCAGDGSDDAGAVDDDDDDGAEVCFDVGAGFDRFKYSRGSLMAVPFPIHSFKSYLGTFGSVVRREADFTKLLFLVPG